jgi:hypothetical protein
LMKTLNMNTVVAPQPSNPRIDATTIHHGLRTFACSLIVVLPQSPGHEWRAGALARNVLAQTKMTGRHGRVKSKE